MNETNDLFLLLFNLSQLKDKSRIISLFCESVSEIFKPLTVKYSEQKLNQGSFEENVATRNAHYGFIYSSKKLSGQAQSRFQNAVQMFAIILERLEYEKRLQQETESSHILADVRLRKNEKYVRELETAKLASLNLIEDLTKEIEIREKAQKELKESEERFALAVMGSNDAIWDWGDIESDEYWWSDRLFEILGYSPGEVEVRISNWIKWMHPDDAESVMEKLNNHFDKGDTYQVEFRMKNKSGDYLWLLVRGESVRNKEGKPLRMAGSVTDITLRKQVDKELRESEEKYRLLFENMTTGFALHDMIYDKAGKPVDYRFKEINPAFTSITGLNASDLIGKTVREALPGIESSWIKKYGDVASRGNPISFEDYAVELDKYFSIYAFSPAKNQFATMFNDISEQKKTQKKILENERELQLVFDNSPAIMILLNEEIQVTKINKTGLEFSGASLDQVINQQVGGAFGCVNSVRNHEGCGKSSECKNCLLRNAILDTVRENRSYNKVETELIMQRKGEPQKFHVLISIVMAAAEPNPTYLLTIDDITTQKMAESALEESYIKYKTLADYTYDWEYWKDPNDHFKYISPSCMRITGYSPQDFIDNDDLFQSLIEMEDHKHWMKHEEKSSKQLPCKNPVEFRIKTKSGKIKWINHVCQPVFDDNGVFMGNRGTNRDITVQKLSQLALTESEMRFKQLADLAFEGIIIHRDGIARDVNVALSRMSGYSENELIGNNLIHLLVDENSKDLVKKRMNQESVEPYEIGLIRKDGKLIPVELYAKWINKQDKLRVTSVRDISDQKQMQQKIINTIIQTEELERKRIAQELHDGLGPVLSTIKLYTQTYISSTKPDFREKIKNQLIIGIDEALVQVSEISNNLSPHVLNDFGINVAIQKFIAKIQKVTKLRIDYHFKYENTIEKDIEITLYRVITELINNSLKHSRADSIDIKVEKDNNNISLNYRDDGIGFDYQKVKSTTHRLGLFNIENRVKSLQGSVEFDQEIGKGVFFRICIPNK